MKMKIYP